MSSNENVTISEIKRMIPRRSLFSDKNYARLVIVGGSGEYYGAPVLAANSAYSSLAALRSGAGYVSLFVPKAILESTRKFSPALVVNQSGTKFVKLTADLKRSIDKARAVVIGMGIGSNPSALKEALKIMAYSASHDKKMVVDADAIRLITNLRYRRNLVITPNDNEFYLLSGTKPSKSDIAKRVASAKKLSERLSIIVVLKGHINIISNGAKARVISSKSAALATMGTGDVLDGIIGAYLAMGMSAFDASVASVYIHSRIGDILFREKGNHIISTDVIEALPKTIKNITGT